MCLFFQGLALFLARKAASANLTHYFDLVLKSTATGDLQKSETILSWLVKKDAKKGLYWFNLGNIRFQRKNFDSAIQSYRNVIRLKSPLSPVAKLYISRSHRMAGKPVEALQELEPLKSILLAEESLDSTNPHLDPDLEKFLNHFLIAERKS